MRHSLDWKAFLSTVKNVVSVAPRSGRKWLAASGSLFAGAALLFAPSPARAATATSTMAVSATVVSSCTVTVTAMAFGTYSNGVATASTSTITPTCTNTTPYTIGLGAGTSSNNSVTQRAMFVSGTPAVLLNYTLTSDAAHATNYATSASITGNGAAQPVTIYGNIPAGQTVAPGAYQDTITVTISY